MHPVLCLFIIAFHRVEFKEILHLIFTALCGYHSGAMTEQARREITRRFQAYVDSFRSGGGELCPMLQLKLTHTMHVVKDAERIMRAETWSAGRYPAGCVCALLHDIGRFSQFAEFGTFRDSESIDHARRGVEVIRRTQMLRDADPETAAQISEAIGWHNRKAVPAEIDGATAALAHLVRDADKLDIFRVMEDAVKDGSIASNPEITWGLSITGAPNPLLVESILRREPVDYALIQSLSDFIMIQIGWVISGFHNASALRMVRERSVVEFRRAYLKSLTDSPAVDRCCDAAAEALRQC
jgi:hypothetical protein